MTATARRERRTSAFTRTLAVVGAAAAPTLAWLLEQMRRSRRAREQETERLRRTAGELNEANRRLRKHDEIRTHFLAMASHELRTPLTSINGFASTLKERWQELDDAQKRQFISIIDEQGERLGRLVNDLLALTRLEGGEYPLRPRPIRVCETIADARAAAGSSSIDVECDRTLCALADPDALQQIVLNLISNARRYGAPPIVIEAEADADSVHIAVADHGPGVPPDFVPHLFSKFAQAPHVAPDPSGTGLGLSIVRELARAQGGDVRYEPNRPRGARFEVLLPPATSGDGR